MLWSLLKILLFVVIVGALTFGAGALMETGSSIRLDIGTTEFTLSPLAAVIGAFVLLGVIWIVFKFVGLAIASGSTAQIENALDALIENLLAATCEECAERFVAPCHEQ